MSIGLWRCLHNDGFVSIGLRTRRPNLVFVAVVGLFLQYCFQANISAGLDSYKVKNETSHSNVTQKQFNLAATKDSVVEPL